MGGQGFGGYNQMGTPQQGAMIDPGMGQQGQFNQQFQATGQHHNMGIGGQQPGGYMAQQPQPAQNFGPSAQYVLLLMPHVFVCVHGVCCEQFCTCLAFSFLA